MATTWWYTPSRCTAPYTIGWGDFGNSSGGVLATKDCDQTQAPDDFTDGDGWTWEELGTVNVEHGELRVRLEDGIGDAWRILIADAVRIESISLAYNNPDPDGDGNTAFRIEGNQLLVNDAGDFNYENSNQLIVTVEVSDGNLTDSAELTVLINDVNDLPTMNQ
ncbi:MAG: cadherin repeat domain-containing protein, partial [Actinomycetales bacterium]|nr:cadherin repeat domain-containing protein [Actinomycetales bacterium]